MKETKYQKLLRQRREARRRYEAKNRANRNAKRRAARRRTIDVVVNTVKPLEFPLDDPSVARHFEDGTIPTLRVSASRLTCGSLDGKKRKKEKR